ncbi:M23 family metallopeptidase [Anabaena sp. FACHB-1237]|uniref:LysM peptidoglycan-binding domain-containing M23 family metallopeptidase n=1 Tax=Anabaena sp. FACHB-1237 TaxID=2692769 RepID=UPI0016803A85|nr:M23 family metallopeptidase [Anabaena sp. FACHB-1237]MBD2139296.1 M23 family metallopeptidase [Anabaena sp. FACHB-1237]
MNIYYHRILIGTSISALGILSLVLLPQYAYGNVANCPIPALARVQRHQVVNGETLETIAQQYNLVPETIINFNPSVRNGVVSAGTQLEIPPYNGIVVEVPKNQTWRQIATKYKVRQDTVFEINGCQKNPKFVFLPIVSGDVVQRLAVNSYNSTPLSANVTTITGYPLQNEINIGLGYGWQIDNKTKDVFFHSGIDLLAPVASPVQAIAPGIVVFAKEQGSYGKLVIINHANGLQSRYAQLDSIKVQLGQRINKSDIIGTVGTTGKPTSSEPHLHFEIRLSSGLGWEAKDPKNYLTGLTKKNTGKN